MLNKFTVFLLLIVISFIIYSCTPMQSVPVNKYKDRYKSALGSDEIPIQEAFQVLLSRRKDGRYIKRVFFPETKQITHYIEYKDKDFEIFHGSYKEWYDNGQLWVEGNYTNDLAQGMWSSFHFPDGKLKSKGLFLDNIKKGMWKFGYSDGGYSEGFLLNDLKHGEWKQYSKDNELTQVVKYELGNITDSKLIKSNTTADPCFDNKIDSLEREEPKFQGGQTELLNFLAKNIKYPFLAKDHNVEGKAIGEFTVSKDGSISNIQVTRGLCESIRKEVQRVLSIMPAWIPGKVESKPVSVKFTLPITFKLED